LSVTAQRYWRSVTLAVAGDSRLKAPNEVSLAVGIS